VTTKNKIPGSGDADSSFGSSAASTIIPLATRLSVEIPKPKDWQALQRNCVLLFRAELGDAHAQEYGRNGQNQGGIDILGRRQGNSNHYVGVQCRLIIKPEPKQIILSDCRKALGLQFGLKEIIFATTAPNDTAATNTAFEVEQILRAEGHDVIVVTYGWEALQNLIALHDVAYAAFVPSSFATSLPHSLATNEDFSADIAAQISGIVIERIQQAGLMPLPRDSGGSGSSDEDPALHARIDDYRDLFKLEKQPVLAESKLLSLLSSENLESKHWARFRIETNLGAIALDLGRETEGATRFETAYAVRPNDSNAIAALALARTIQGRYEDAMGIARRALDALPRADHAVSYLLQAAARSSWQGNPETLIPADLIGSEHADLGLAEFLRRRDVPEWQERTLELGRRHINHDSFKQIRALAVLSLLVDGEGIISKKSELVTPEEISSAADDLKGQAEHCLNVGFANQHDLIANVSNAALLLRIAGRDAECESLLLGALPKTPNDPQLCRLLALSQMTLGRQDEALATILPSEDAENQIMAAELLASIDPGAAHARLDAIDPEKLNSRLTTLRWGLIGELALRSGDSEKIAAAVSALREQNVDDVYASVLELRSLEKAGLTKSEAQAKLRALTFAQPTEIDVVSCYLLAEELRAHDLAAEAADLVEGHVDLTRRNSFTTLYLQSLAAARQDDRFLHAIEKASVGVRNDPEIQWTVAAHAWNTGDLKSAFQTIETLIEREPKNARARLMKIEILIRQDRSAELLAELDNPVEDLNWTRLQDRFRLASLLGHFGYGERAAALAYRMFLENRDKSQAWMSLSSLVLNEGRGMDSGLRNWDAPVVAHNVAVDIRYDDGEETFLVVEPDPKLRQLDPESWEPEHPLVQTISGLAKGTRFSYPQGRNATIVDLRHKYVARTHYVMKNHDSRFPEIFGFRKISGDVEQPGGLDALIAELKERNEWFVQEQEQYRNANWPIGVLARRLGCDTIDVAQNLASRGVSLKVALGSESERMAASHEIFNNSRKGCVLDLLGYWTAWRLEALDSIATICGPIHLPQGVLDSLRTRRERIGLSLNEGFQSLSYESGRPVYHEVDSAVIRKLYDELEAAIHWGESNAIVCPLVAGKNLSTQMRNLLRQSDIFDSVVLAMQAGLLLVTDDLPTREFSQSAGGGRGVWLHLVFSCAFGQNLIAEETFIRWSSELISAGHSYIGVSGRMLTRALQLDAESGEAPGSLFKTLSSVIGGQIAEPRSHIEVCVQCLHDLWAGKFTPSYHKCATGLLLRMLIRERFHDYAPILRIVIRNTQRFPDLVEYVRSWARGHFISETALQDSAAEEAPNQHDKRR
jgi:cellulose synthase operon protein C